MNPSDLSKKRAHANLSCLEAQSFDCISCSFRLLFARISLLLFLISKSKVRNEGRPIEIRGTR